MKDCLIKQALNMTFGQPVPEEVDALLGPTRSCHSITMITPKLKANEERKKLIRICSQKLENIKDPDINLRRSVCINNTYCRLRDEVRREKEYKRGAFNEDYLNSEYGHDTDGSFLDKTIEVSEVESNYRNDLMEICEDAAKDECESSQGSSFSLDLANAFKIHTCDLDLNKCSDVLNDSTMLVDSEMESIAERTIALEGNEQKDNKDYYVLRKLGEPSDNKQIVRELESIDKELDALPCFQPSPYRDLIPNVLLDVLDSAGADETLGSKAPKFDFSASFSATSTSPTKTLSNFESSFNAFCKYSYSEFESNDSDTDQSSNDSIGDDMMEMEPSPKRICLGLQSFTNSNASCSDAYRHTDSCGQPTRMDNSQTSVFVA